MDAVRENLEWRREHLDSERELRERVKVLEDQVDYLLVALAFDIYKDQPERRLEAEELRKQ